MDNNNSPDNHESVVPLKKKIQKGGGPIQDFCKSAVWVSAVVKGTYLFSFFFS